MGRKGTNIFFESFLKSYFNFMFFNKKIISLIVIRINVWHFFLLKSIFLTDNEFELNTYLFNNTPQYGMVERFNGTLKISLSLTELSRQYVNIK